VSRAERRELWRARIKAFKESGMSRAAWCAAEGIKKGQLQYWLHALEPKASSTTTGPSGWLPVAIADPDSSADPGGGLLIRVGKIAIEVQPGFDRALLADVVRTLAVLC
jgi:hypothetical protein